MAPKPETGAVRRVNRSNVPPPPTKNPTAQRSYDDDVDMTSHKQYTFWSAFVELFLTTTRFGVHRAMGMIYLVQFFASLYLMTFDYNTYLRTPLGWTLPLTGWFQAIIASLTFTFLPKGIDAQGYYSDKRTITYSFMLENIYFSGLLLFQALYCFSPLINKLPLVAQAVLVFLPYTCIRVWFPKTSLGESRNQDNQYSDSNRSFLKFISLLSKVFYVIAKHMNG